VRAGQKAFGLVRSLGVQIVLIGTAQIGDVLVQIGIVRNGYVMIEVAKAWSIVWRTVDGVVLTALAHRYLDWVVYLVDQTEK
jgi:hypothetical protein